ncbi:hypothetical protein GCM10022221_67250 [Actinocorallia aurea]
MMRPNAVYDASYRFAPRTPGPEAIPLNAQAVPRVQELLEDTAKDAGHPWRAFALIMAAETLVPLVVGMEPRTGWATCWVNPSPPWSLHLAVFADGGAAGPLGPNVFTELHPGVRFRQFVSPARLGLVLFRTSPVRAASR